MSNEPNTGKREAPGWVGTPHGRFVYVVDGWQNEFHLRDHLGNTRVVVMEGSTGTLATLQQNHYYPFGMLNPSLSTSNTSLSGICNSALNMAEFAILQIL